MKIIIIYKSKTGFTKTYAEWICEELHCEMISIDQIKEIDLSVYDFVIYGAGIMAGKMYSLDKIKSLVLPQQQLILFATAATNKDATSIIEKIKNDNLTVLGRQVPFYYFEAGIQYEKMGFFPKKMLRMMYKSLQKKSQRTDEEEGMMLALAHSCDHTNKEYIQPLIEYVKQSQ